MRTSKWQSLVVAILAGGLLTSCSSASDNDAKAAGVEARNPVIGASEGSADGPSAAPSAHAWLLRWSSTASTSTSHARVRRSSASPSTSSYAWVRWWSSTTTSPSNDAWVCRWSAATSSNAWFRWSPATSSTTWLLWRTAASTWCTTTSGCQDGWLASGAYL